MLADSDAVLKWAIGQLPQNEIFFTESVCTTPYSQVSRLKSANGCYYLKQAPAHLFREAAITKLLEDICPDIVPHLYASDSELGCFLMPDAGIQLREFIKAGGDFKLFGRALQGYAGLQQATVGLLPQFLALGVPDWRLSNLPDLFLQMLQHSGLAEAGLLSDEKRRLEAYSQTLADQCAKLKAFGIPETIEHPDFHDKNIVVNGGDVRVIDWGEAVISHPFFSLARFLFSVGRHHEIGADHPLYAQLKTAYLSCWKNSAPEQDIAAAYSLIDQLALPYSALSYAQLANACGAQGQHFWGGSILPLLQRVGAK